MSSIQNKNSLLYALDGKTYRDIIEIYGHKEGWSNTRIEQEIQRYNGDFSAFATAYNLTGDVSESELLQMIDKILNDETDPYLKKTVIETKLSDQKTDIEDTISEGLALKTDITDFNTLNNRVDALTSVDSSTLETIGKIEEALQKDNDVYKAVQQIASNKDEIADIDGRVTTNSTVINEHTTKINKNIEDINNLSSNKVDNSVLSNYYIKTEVDTKLSGKVTGTGTLAESLEPINTSLAKKADADTVEKTYAKPADIDSKISSFNTETLEASYYKKTDVYTKTETNTLIEDILTQINSSYTTA